MRAASTPTRSVVLPALRSPWRRAPRTRPAERRPRRCSCALDGAELVEQALHLVLGVVVDDADPNRTVVQPEAPHDLDRVVVAVPHGEAALAKPLGRDLRRDGRVRDR